MGEAAVVKDGVIVKTYHHGDFFGETALVTGEPRSADVRAKTALSLLTIDKHDFLSFLRGTDLPQALVRLAVNRDLPSWDLIGDNGVLRELRAKQRTRLQSRLEHCVLSEGVVLDPDAAWLIDDAVVEVDGVRVGRAAFVVDADALTRRRPLRSRALVVKAGGAFRVGPADLAELLEDAPALLLALSGLEVAF